MTISLWVSVMVALIAALFAAIIAPIVTAALTRKHWKTQTEFQLKEKSFQLKYEVFQGAVDALAAWAADALDPGLQESKPSFKGLSHQVAMRPQTAQALERYRSLVAALFSIDITRKFEDALRAKISIDNVPNTEFENRRITFVVAAARELGLDTRPDA